MQLLQGDCLDVMPSIPDGSVDMVLADPPFGTTQCKWDSVIELAPMWDQLKRIIKPNGAIVINAAQPFTSALIASNYPMFKYCWVWDKVDKYTNHLNAKHQPMRRHEDVVVFAKNKTAFNQIRRKGSYVSRKTKAMQSEVYGKHSNVEPGVKIKDLSPCSVLPIKTHKQTKGLHPSEKPVSLMEYMISTYSNEGETVLDFTMGSGTTGVACKNLNREFIGIELDANYFKIASERIDQHDIMER